jgi:hypothetical protein
MILMIKIKIFSKKLYFNKTLINYQKKIFKYNSNK